MPAPSLASAAFSSVAFMRFKSQLTIRNLPHMHTASLAWLPVPRTAPPCQNTYVFPLTRPSHLVENPTPDPA